MISQLNDKSYLKKYIYILNLIFIIYTAFPQKETYNWYFGNSAGITFNPSGTAPSVISDGQLLSPEACSVISDSTGSLLFYTNGETVWNKNHEIMQNGAGIGGTNTASQGAIIIPKPKSQFIYYVFTINAVSRTLAYSTVDIRLNSGLGAVTDKNNQFLPNVTQKMSAVHHTNGVDIWLVAHGWLNNSYFSILINSGGIATTPIISNTGTVHKGTSDNEKGNIKIAPDGSMVACTLPADTLVELSIFNRGNGSVSNTILLPVSADTKARAMPYSAEFSPDCSHLFVSARMFINSYDVSTKDSVRIINSAKTVWDLNASYFGLQLAPDGRIYVAYNNNTILKKINEPNKGVDISVQTGPNINLVNDRSNMGLPATIQSFYSWIYIPSILTICEGDSIITECKLSCSIPIASFRWTGPLGFSSSGPNLILPKVTSAQGGYYYISVNAGALKFNDSLYVKVVPKPKAFIIPDGSTTLCEGDSLKLFAQPQGIEYSYLWNTYETTNTITVSKAGKYSVTVESNGCRDSDTIDIKTVPGFIPEIIVDGPKVLCEGDTMLLSAKPEGYGYRYNWSTGDTVQSTKVARGGIFHLSVEKDGCVRTTSINIQNIKKPEFHIAATGPTVFCEGDSVVLTVEPFDPDISYLWSTGEASQSIIVKNTGLIYVEAFSRNGCSTLDSVLIKSGSELGILIESNPKPPFCKNDIITLTSYPVAAGFKYNWSTGDTTPSIQVSLDGKYYLEVTTIGGCKGRDSFDLKIYNRPDASLKQGSMNEICDGDSLLLTPNIIDNINNYSWNDGITSAIRYVSKSGKYKLLVNNPAGCRDSSEFELILKQSPVIDINIIRKPKICNGDTVTLVAVTDNPGYSLIWSNGETKDTIIVTKSGIYRLTVTNLTGCKRIDSVAVMFNPQPELKILTDKGYSLCPGDSVTLTAENPYFKYIWNTGDTTRSLRVGKAGIYRLSVYDSTGCESTSEAAIHDAEVMLSGLEDLDFGKTDRLLSRNISEEFWNSSQDKILIDTIYAIGANTAFEVMSENSQIELTMSDLRKLTVKFSPQDMKYYSDTLVFEISKPCRDRYFIILNGVGVGTARVSMPDTFGIIGTRKFRIPIRAKVLYYGSDPIVSSYTAQVRFYSDVFLPEILTNGIIRNDTVINGERILKIEDNNAIISGRETVLSEITGTILLGEHAITPLIIDYFNWGNPLVKTELKSGKLEALSVCFQDINRIIISDKTRMSIAPNPAGESTEIGISNVSDAVYTLAIYSIDGSEVAKYIIDNTREVRRHIDFKLPMENLSSGIYKMLISGNGEMIISTLSVMK